ncbi:MAG: hypothetical protein Q7I91_10155, partial [Moraxellaceae bacterium]|nr:hypothetical protein [Moraxellaceae bacterium]
SECRSTGSLIAIDRLSNVTLGAGMVHAPADALSAIDTLPAVTTALRARRLGHPAIRIVIESSAARELAELVERVLFNAGAMTAVVNADQVTEIDALLAAGLIVIVADEVVGERSLRIRGVDPAIAPIQLAKSNVDAAEQVLKLLREQHVLG